MKIGNAVRWLMIVVLVGSMLALARHEWSFHTEPESWTTVRVAVVGPGSGDGAPDGEAFERGVRLYAQQLEQDRDRPLRLEVDFFDDANEAELAVQRAEEVVAGGYHAVIGHKYSSCSIEAGAVYDQAGIPALSPTSTDLGVTTARPWYFRTVYSSPRQGAFLAEYSAHVLDARRVALVAETKPYGEGVAAAYVQACGALGSDEQGPLCEVVAHETFDNDIYAGEELDGKLHAIVAGLLALESRPDAVILATHAPEAAELVETLRQRGYTGALLGSNTLASRAFLEAFDPGQEHHAQNVYVTAPLVLDAGEPHVQAFRAAYREAWMGQEPDWRAVTAYDAAALLVGAAEAGEFSGAPEDLAQDRELIRRGLARLSLEEDRCEGMQAPGLRGLSGLNCFDEQGSPEAKDIQVGQFLSGDLVSAPVQLQRVELADVPDLERARERGMVDRVGEEWKAHSDVVYTGFELQAVSEIDVDEETARLKFLLWFRGPVEDDIADIVFSNAAGEVHMELVQERDEGEGSWQLYEVDGTFWTDWQDDSPDLDLYELGFSFHHRSLSVERLRYVADARAMASGPRTHLPEDWRVASMRTEISRETTRTRGHPALLGVGDRGPEFSHFTHWVQVRPAGLQLRRQGRSEETPWGLFIAILGLLLLSNLDHRGRSRLTLAAVRGLQTAAAIGALLSFEEWLVSNWWLLPFRPEGWHRPELRQLLKVVDAAWWVLPAAALDRLVEEQIWVPLESRTRRIPNVVRRLGTVLLYTLAGCGIIAFVADAKLTSLVATSGVLTLVIGLGLQVNLENLMAGLALNLEQPFRIGDRVRIGDYEPGEVVDITWRTTKLRLDDGSELNVPNLTASTEKLVRLDQPAEE